MLLKAFMKKHSLKEGNEIKVTIGKTVFEGTIIPSNNEMILRVKASTGYNAGFDVNAITAIKITGKGSTTGKHLKKEKHVFPKSPKIAILHTGGTIASRVDYAQGGVFASFDLDDLIALYPELTNSALLESRLVSNMMSEDMRFENYQAIAKAVQEEIANGVDGVIIGHGTDTLAYTSAVLAFMFEHLPVPVLVVGAQRSSDRGSSDAGMNLACAIEFIKQSDFAGVAVCMHATSNDDYCHILPGTKTRKMHTSRRDAFKAINALPIAKVTYANKKVEMLSKQYEKRSKNKPVLKDKFEEKVGILKAYPNMLADQLLFFKEKKYKGLILETTGIGHMPINTSENKKVYDALKSVIDSGCIVAVTSQCINGRVHENIYTNARKLAELGTVFCEDMLAETAYMKLSWLLGNYSAKEAKAMLAENLRGEITHRTEIETFSQDFN